MKKNKQGKILSPADFIIEYFGGLRPAARALGRSHAAINLWRKPKKQGGCDGFIPRIAMHQILDLAKKNKWGITGMDLVLGRIVSQTKKNGRKR